MKKDKIILLCNNSQIRLINKKNLANLQIASLNINQFINKKFTIISSCAIHIG